MNWYKVYKAMDNPLIGIVPCSYVFLGIGVLFAVLGLPIWSIILVAVVLYGVDIGLYAFARYKVNSVDCDE